MLYEGADAGDIWLKACMLGLPGKFLPDLEHCARVLPLSASLMMWVLKSRSSATGDELVDETLTGRWVVQNAGHIQIDYHVKMPYS